MPFGNALWCGCCEGPPPTGCLTLRCRMTTCTGGPVPANATYTMRDESGTAIPPDATTDNTADFSLCYPHHYTLCAAVPAGWTDPGCVGPLSPRGGVLDFYTGQAPRVIRLTSASQTCNGGMYQSDELTWSATCPFAIKPNGLDLAGYYGGGEKTIRWVEHLGPYSPCGPFHNGTTVYDDINGATFYYFIPATAPGVPEFGYELFTVATNGPFPGGVGGPIALNGCSFPYTETAASLCGGYGPDGFALVGVSPCDIDDVILCNCFRDPGMCLEVVTTIETCHPNGLPAGAFSLTWEIAS